MTTRQPIDQAIITALLMGLAAMILAGVVWAIIDLAT